MIKKISIFLVFLFASPFIIALFVTNNYAVEREISIALPKEQVFNYVKQLKNQNNFSKWALTDPNMSKSYRGTDAMPGFVSAWSSANEEVGSGEQEILSIVEGERINFELRFFTPFQSTDNAYMTTQSIGEDLTKVSWGFNGQLKYPMNIMFLFMDFESVIGSDLQTGLNNLKVLLEKESIN